MSAARGCLGDDEIAALAGGRLADDATGARAHLADCDECRELVAQLARDATIDSPPTEAKQTPLARPRRKVANERIAGATEPSDFDGYRLLRPIGAGAMGQVYLGHDTLLDRAVAIKLISAEEPDAAARERFRIEARAIARLQHPNVVAIYRVGEADGRPYLVSEYIRGKNLAQLTLPLPNEQLIRIGMGLARGLAAAHRRGVLHRDLKPANAILDEDGEVKLVDFGLAKIDQPLVQDLADTHPEHTPPTGRVDDSFTSEPTQKAAPAGRSADERPPFAAQSRTSPRLDSPGLTSPGTMVGTPLYMAPEMWLGGPATAQSDIYSIGVMLFELAAARVPHREPNLTKLAAHVLGKDAPPLASVAPTAHPELAAIVDRCLRRDPDDRFASADELRDALEALADRRAAPLPDGNPYRGLRSFEAEHRALFFGRTRAVRDVVERLRAESFVLVAGDSGVGKSSLCRAGVLPLVTDSGFGDARRWSSLVMLPGRNPLATLRGALASHLGAELDASDGHDVARALRKRHQEHSGLVIFVDQLEELVTLSDPAEAQAFGILLTALLQAQISLRVLATVRGDFLTRLATVTSLAPRLARALYILSSLPPDGIREAILGPAQRMGVRFESETLVDTLVDATAGVEGSLPLLQFALAELWEVRDPAAKLITAASLEKLGGVAGALARHADAVIASLRPPQRRLARQMLSQLVTVEGTRARRDEAELGVMSADDRAVLEALVNGRLVVARESELGVVYEIAHEVLIRGWPSLRGWLEGAAESRAVKQRLDGAVAEWRRLDRRADLLWNERQLAEVALIDGEKLSAPQVEFVAASRRAIVRVRRRRQVIVASVLATVALVYGGVRLRARYELHARVAVHVDRATHQLDEARHRDADVETERARAFAAFDREERAAGEAAWQQARAQAKEVEARYANAAEALETALLLDATRDDVKRQLVEVLYERALLAERDHRNDERDELLRRLHLYDVDGAAQRRWNAPAELRLTTSPPGAHVRIDRYVSDAEQRRVPTFVADAGPTPLAATSLPPGSYLLTLTIPGHVDVRYPVLLARAEKFSADVRLPATAEVPPGFVYIPPGRFLYGSAADETMRRSFANAAPIHQRASGAFFIARYETTFKEWLRYLRQLSPQERAQRIPRAAMGMDGQIALASVNSHTSSLILQPIAHRYEAGEGELIHYQHRNRRANQDWLSFPVSGMSCGDAEAYASWLASTSVPGARLCGDVEWERAARGADDRLYPHGDALHPEDANYDDTYARDPLAMGPDEVGSHPASRSPFGVDDIIGNVWELVRGAELMSRGGSFYFAALTNIISNREYVHSDIRDVNVGFRICAGGSDQRP